MKKIAFLLCFIVSFISSTQAQTIHKFIVTDPTEPFRENDRKKMDEICETIKRLLMSIPGSPAIKVQDENIDRVFTPDQLRTKLNAIHLTTISDIIVYYFSGKGDTKGVKENNRDKKFPTLFVKDNLSIGMNEVMNILRAKKARLTLVISECGPVAASDKKVSISHAPMKSKNAQMLFQPICKHEFVAISASCDGQSAKRIDSNVNSYFLRCFEKSLDELLSKDGIITWNSLRVPLNQELKSESSKVQTAYIKVTGCAGDPFDNEEEEEEVKP